MFFQLRFPLISRFSFCLLLCGLAEVLVAALCIPNSTWLLVNLPPTPVNDYATTPEDQPRSVWVVVNDTDPDGTVIPTTITLYTPPPNGLALIDDLNGIVVYVPNPDFNGADSLAYQVCDDDGACSQAWLFMTILPVNDAPAVRRDTLSLPSGSSAWLFPLINDDDLRDPGSGLDYASFQRIEEPLHGLLDTDTGTLRYTPDPGFAGLDSFHYQICDLGLPMPARCGEAWFQLSVDVSPTTGPVKPQSADFAPCTLVLDPGRLVYTGRMDTIHHEFPDPPSRQGVLRVYDRDGRIQLEKPVWPEVHCSPEALRRLNLPVGLYSYAWWDSAANQPLPSRRGSFLTGN